MKEKEKGGKTKDQREKREKKKDQKKKRVKEFFRYGVFKVSQ